MCVRNPVTVRAATTVQMELRVHTRAPLRSPTANHDPEAHGCAFATPVAASLDGDQQHPTGVVGAQACASRFVTHLAKAPGRRC
jgi:hypothetical protein